MRERIIALAAIFLVAGLFTSSRPVMAATHHHYRHRYSRHVVHSRVIRRDFASATWDGIDSRYTPWFAGAAEPPAPRRVRYHRRFYRRHPHYDGRVYGSNVAAARARGLPWCGAFMADHLGIHGVAGRELWLARNWTRWGRRALGAAPGVIGVMAHHVFQVVAVLGPHRVMAISGNDGHSVRTRERSTKGVIAWREE